LPAPSLGPTLRIATRGSTLARWQSEAVGRLVRSVRPDLQVELVVVSTVGDRRSEVPVWEMGGQGVFVAEVQAAVLDGRADVAVHSAKDLPSSTAPGLALAAAPARADWRDALVGSRVADLRPGAVVATGSVRRRAQLAWMRPDLTFTGLRGNIATRLERVPDGGAVVVAAAALERLGLLDRADEILRAEDMLPQVGQGAIAVECRVDDAATGTVLAAIDDAGVRAELTAERSYLARLGGGCDVPVGALGRHLSQGSLLLEGLMASADGRVLLRSSVTGPAASAATLGTRLADELLAAGGSDLLWVDSADREGSR
jgi:hydroxymethylbilane synthase